MEFINQIITTTLSSFDFSFCVIVNILTYILIKIFDYFNKDKPVKFVIKRLLLFASVIVITIAYVLIGFDNKLILNSAILAPVSWSWIIRPILKYFKLDYKKIDILE